MKIPRDISGDDLIKRLTRLGYAISRKSGSHVRLTTEQGGEHHITVPMHSSLRLGTLSAILNDVAGHFKITKEQVAEELFNM